MTTSKTFTYQAPVYKTSTAGVYTTSNYTKSTGTNTVYDNIQTTTADNLSQIGDVTGDTFTVNNGSTTKTYTYVSETSTGNGFIATFVSAKTGKNVYVLYSNTAYSYGSTIKTVSGAITLCFLTGTHIRTTRGDVTVEELRAGDVAITGTGDHRKISWIGHRDIESRGAALPVDQWPVQIRANAFGPGLPVRDLRLSPGHPVLVGADEDGNGGSLVPVMCLINGTTIERVEMAALTYWHVELESHDILLAEGLPAESFLDFGCRGFFDEASDHALENPDFIVPGLSGRCRPVAVDGPVVEAARAKLGAIFAADLAAQCDWLEPSQGVLFAA